MIQQSPIQSLLSSIEPVWSGRNLAPACVIPRVWRKTLFDSSSLTAQLVALGQGTFEVKVLAQGWRQLSAGECQLLGVKPHQNRGWTRDVALCIHGKAWVYARTCIPASTLTGSEKRLAQLGDKPLGAYLFQHPAMKRGKMTASKIRQNGLDLKWSRRSVFYLHQKPLLVSEAFIQPLQ